MAGQLGLSMVRTKAGNCRLIEIVCRLIDLERKLQISIGFVKGYDYDYREGKKKIGRVMINYGFCRRKRKGKQKEGDGLILYSEVMMIKVMVAGD